MKWLPKAFNIIFSTEFIKILTVDFTATLHLSTRCTKVMLSGLIWIFMKPGVLPFPRWGLPVGDEQVGHMALSTPLSLSGSQFPHYKIRSLGKNEH